MAGATLTFDASDADDALGRMLSAAGDLRPALKNIAEHEVPATKRRFIAQADPEGKPWAALNPLYATTKKGPGILRSPNRTLSREILYQLADQSVTIGSNQIYARIHNEGGTIVPKTASALVFSMGGQTFKVKSVTIPRRQFLGWSETDIRAVIDIVADHLMPDRGAPEPDPN
ncbi:phage virion morphogenesis protein [Ensifer soli]|uniref:phage virion morphogenesis protein n=1 Tax=Ciceribacter sp. sgz301302 TaxID=3342379 RepID=UPI0035BB62C3